MKTYTIEPIPDILSQADVIDVLNELETEILLEDYTMD